MNIVLRTLINRIKRHLSLNFEINLEFFFFKHWNYISHLFIVIEWSAAPHVDQIEQNGREARIHFDVRLIQTKTRSDIKFVFVESLTTKWMHAICIVRLCGIVHFPFALLNLVRMRCCGSLTHPRNKWDIYFFNIFHWYVSMPNGTLKWIGCTECTNWSSNFEKHCLKCELRNSEALLCGSGEGASIFFDRFWSVISVSL